MRKQRIGAGVLSLLLMVSIAGCAQTSSSEGTLADGLGQASGEENENGDGSFAGEDTLTALDIMEKYNTAPENLLQDNYGTTYEIFVYSFYDSDGDGVGDLNGITQQLDYIQSLGVQSIWLTPVMPSTTYHKYDVTDYYGIDPEYGTLEDYEALVDECHDRGMNIIMDLVLNHSSSQHPWFREAVSYLEGLTEGEEPNPEVCPYVDYYHFTTKSGSGYYQVGTTEWYYEAPFWSEMPDLNLESEAVRGEIEQIVDFWMDLGVDGFRLDAAKEYVTGDTDANIEILTWLNSYVKEKNPDAYLVAEAWTDEAVYMKYYASGIDSCFNFSFADSDGVIASSVKNGNAQKYANALLRIQEELSEYEQAIDAPFFTNHDMGRAAGYFPGEYKASQIKLAQAMNLLMTGNAFLYYGEELGMKGSGADENKRAPMQWSSEEDAAGMCDGPAGMEEIAMPFAPAGEQETDGNSILNFIRQVTVLKNAYPALSRGTAELVAASEDGAVCTISKTYEEETLYLVFNASSETEKMDLAALSSCEVCGVLVSEAEEPVFEDGVLSIPGYSVVILRNAEEN